MNREKLKKALMDTKRKLGKPGGKVGRAIGKGLLPKKNITSKNKARMK